MSLHSRKTGNLSKQKKKKERTKNKNNKKKKKNIKNKKKKKKKKILVIFLKKKIYKKKAVSFDGLKRLNKKKGNHSSHMTGKTCLADKTNLSVNMDESQ